MWDNMDQLLHEGGATPPNTLFQADLTVPTYSYTGGDIQLLESKEKIKESIDRNPDLYDALALIFAAPVALTMTGLNFRKEEELTTL